MAKNRIKALAAEADITIPELAEKAGMNAPALRRYTRHTAEPKLGLAIRLAEVLGCTPDEVMGMKPVEAPSASRKIPCFGGSRGEIDILVPKDFIEAHPAIASAVNAYAVFVSNDDMKPRFSVGDIVYVHPAKPVDAGCPVVVQFENGTAKICEYHDEQIESLSGIKVIHRIIGSYIS